MSNHNENNCTMCVACFNNCFFLSKKYLSSRSNEFKQYGTCK